MSETITDRKKIKIFFFKCSNVKCIFHNLNNFDTDDKRNSNSPYTWYNVISFDI